MRDRVSSGWLFRGLTVGNGAVPPPRSVAKQPQLGLLLLAGWLLCWLLSRARTADSCSNAAAPSSRPPCLLSLDTPPSPPILPFDAPSRPALAFTSYWNCTDCLTAYKDWACAISFPKCTTGGEDIVRPCRDVCHWVTKKCPYVLNFKCPDKSFQKDYSDRQDYCLDYTYAERASLNMTPKWDSSAPANAAAFAGTLLLVAASLVSSASL